MQRLYILLMICCATAGRSFALDTVKAPCAIYLMPSQLLPLIHAGGFTIGTEQRICSRMSLSLEAGLFYLSGHMEKVNLKYYFNPYINENGDDALYYFAVEYAYKKQAYNAGDYIKGTDYEPSDIEVKYRVHKTASTFNFKFGSLQSIIKGAYFDAYIGLGIRYISSRNDLPAGKTEELFYWNDGFIDASSNATYTGFKPSVALGFKIGYRYR